MARVWWSLANGRPIIEVWLRLNIGGQRVKRVLLADTGAGSQRSGFELLLTASDCAAAGHPSGHTVALSGAYRGSFPIQWVSIEIPGLAFSRSVRAAAIAVPPPRLDGIAAFRFLNRFTYGNFGDPTRFGLEV